jgi:hypothetical protein
MDSYLVTKGVYDLRDAKGTSSAAMTKRHFQWLKAHYAEKGWPRSRIQRDILRLAHHTGRIEACYAAQVFDLYYRLLRSSQYQSVGVANECCPYSRFNLPGWGELRFEVSGRGPRRLPQIVWAPFKIVSRTRVWRLEELRAAIRRGPPFH